MSWFARDSSRGPTPRAFYRGAAQAGHLTTCSELKRQLLRSNLREYLANCKDVLSPNSWKPHRRRLNVGPHKYGTGAVATGSRYHTHNRRTRKEICNQTTPGRYGSRFRICVAPPPPVLLPGFC